MGDFVRFRDARFSVTTACGAVLAFLLSPWGPQSAANEFSWSTPMGEIAGPTADDALIVVLVTNDVAAELTATRQSTERSGCWCERPFRRSVTRIPAGYFAPSAPIQFQHWPIGLPPIINGGEDASDVNRALVFLTDGQYRILAMSVGVPGDDELTGLIEDAEDTRMLLRRHADDPNEMIRQLADRTRGRLTRIWQITLDQQLTALGETSVDPIRDLLGETERHTSNVQLQLVPIASQLQGVYLKDVGMRFGLSDGSDFQRLVVLEQHSATRMPWATVLLPFLVGADLRSLSTDFAEIVWHRWVMPIKRPGQPDAETTTLADWIDQHGEQDPLALRLPAPLMSNVAKSERFEVTDVARRRGLGWQDLDDALSGIAVREVTAGELAEWLSQSQGQPLDIARPSRVRVLFFRSPNDSPFPIREGSPPGRAITMIRQVQK